MSRSDVFAVTKTADATVYAGRASASNAGGDRWLW